jgi:hypothetical protein
MVQWSKAMSGRPCARILALTTVCAAALWGSSCGDGARGGARDAGGAGYDGGTAGRDGGGTGQDGGDANTAHCPAPGELTAEPPPRQVALDVGVPLDQFVYALAVARCSYMSRCFALSTYAANKCVDQIVSNASFYYSPTGVTIIYHYPSDALLQAAAAGVVRYDAQQASRCISALLAEGCAGYTLIEYLPACAGVFTCAAGDGGAGPTDGSSADGGAGPTDGGLADGGSTCPELVAPYNDPLQTCSIDEDCAGVTAGQGPDCVAGICARSRCGYFPISGGCTSFAAVGERCGSNAFSNLNASPAEAPDAMCAPGLGCQGRTFVELGTCVVPMDVGGACTDNDNCKPGLACACGTCEIPPAAGPCANGLCELGTTYCDRASNTCHPVRPAGADCTYAPNSCAPGLSCVSRCQPL